MTKTRIKRTMTHAINRAEAELALAELSSADFENKRIQADMDLAIARIRETYQDKVEANFQIIDEKTRVLQEFLRQNPEILGRKRSIAMTFGQIGYRLGQPALKSIKGFTWDACKDLVKELVAPAYIRTREELDKERLLLDRDKPLTAVFRYEAGHPLLSLPEAAQPRLSSLFEKCGFKVSQEETFFVEPKQMEVNP